MSAQKSKRPNSYKRKRNPSPPAPISTLHPLLPPQSLVPSTQDELALHPKKKKDLNDLFSDFTSSGSGKVVLVVGPSGSGKATAIQVIAAVQGLAVAVWRSVEVASEVERRDEMVMLKGVDEFAQYLKMECGVPKIRLGNKAKPAAQVILVRHLPTISGPEDKIRLGNALATVISYQLRKLVLITLSHDEHFAVESAFPAAIQVIQFNEIAPTLLDKAISRLAGLLSLSQSKEDLQMLRVQSQGDLRAAQNALLLLSAAQSPPQACKKPKQETTKGRSDGKDQVLDLFHALGKFLIHKSTSHTGIGPNGEPLMMTADLLQPVSTRPKLYFSPEQVLTAVDSDIGLFVHMLHENFIDYMDEIDDISATLDCFSLGDLVQRPRFGQVSPEETEQLRYMEARIVGRGLLHHNFHPISHGKAGFAKSQMRGYGRDLRSTTEELRRKLCKRQFYEGLTPFDVVLHEEMYFSAFQMAEKAEERARTVDRVDSN